MEIKALEMAIKNAQIAYYNGSSVMDDDEYDALVYELGQTDPENQLLKIVGAEPTTEWKKEKHLFPLGSLNKVNSSEEMTKWTTEKFSADEEFLIVEKLDGLSIGCEFHNEKLTKGILRGGGHEGENILANVLKMKGAVTSIPGFTGVLRGEIVLTKSDHQTYFSSYANPRNAASGLCRRLDGEGCEHLTIMFYQVLGKDFSTEQDQFTFLESNKCMTPNHKICRTSKEINQLREEYESHKRLSLDYEIDGLVVSCNDIKKQQSMGETNLRPKGKMAFKFANQFIKTSIKDITFITGNSGRTTPICWFEPVNLLGSLISKASAYNVAYIQKLGLDIGAEVLICKAGEIIPRVEKVVKSTGTIVAIPTNCPSCSSILEIQGEYLQCPNTLGCLAQVTGKIKNWIKELDVKEYGEALLDRLVESGKVKTIVDLYKLSVDDLANIERMGERSATTCHRLLWEKINIPLEVFLGGLSISMIGQSSIKLIIASGLNTLDKILSAKIEDLEKVSGMGPGRSRSLYDGLVKNKSLINDLLDIGIKIQEKEKVMGILSGKSIVFTGKMENKRSELEAMAQVAGAEVRNAVGKNVNFLVIADPENSTSSKAVAARKFGTRLISEEYFLSMVK